MIAFMSVSVNWSSERTLVGFRLSDYNLSVISNNTWNEEMDFFNKGRIAGASLFVGFMTTDKNMDIVLDEWHYAQSKGIPNILLVEDVVQLPDNLSGNIIIFNREKPQKAISEIKKRMKMTLPSKTLKREDVIAWTLGGEALIDVLEWFMIPAQEALVTQFQ